MLIEETRPRIASEQRCALTCAAGSILGSLRIAGINSGLYYAFLATLLSHCSQVPNGAGYLKHLASGCLLGYVDAEGK